MTPQCKAWVSLLGCVFMLFPFCILVIISSWPFVADAYTWNEGSPDPGGLPYRWLLKAAIPPGFLLVMLQGLVLVLRSAQTIFCPSACC